MAHSQYEYRHRSHTETRITAGFFFSAFSLSPWMIRLCRKYCKVRRLCLLVVCGVCVCAQGGIMCPCKSVSVVFVCLCLLSMTRHLTWTKRDRLARVSCTTQKNSHLMLNTGENVCSILIYSASWVFVICVEPREVRVPLSVW